MNDTPTDYQEPANLRFLRILVTVLTITMIVGLLSIVALLVIRFSGETSAISLPSEIALPDGTSALAFTQGTDWYAVVTSDNQILIFDRSDNSLRQSIAIN